MLSSACYALNFRHIESVLILFHTLTVFCCFQTQNGASPVYVASMQGHTEVVDLLVQAEADINLATTDEVHVTAHTVSSSVLGTNIRLIDPCPRMRSEGYCAQFVCQLVGLSVCWSICLSIRSLGCPPFFLNNHGSSGLQTWTCYEAGCIDGKI